MEQDWIDNRDSTKLNILVGPHAKPDIETNDTLDMDAFTRLQYFGRLYTEDAAQQSRTVLVAFAQRLNAPEAPTTLAVRAQQPRHPALALEIPRSTRRHH